MRVWGVVYVPKLPQVFRRFTDALHRHLVGIWVLIVWVIKKVDHNESLDAMKSMGVTLTGLPDSEKSRLAAVSKSVKDHWNPGKK